MSPTENEASMKNGLNEGKRLFPFVLLSFIELTQKLLSYDVLRSRSVRMDRRLQ